MSVNKVALLPCSREFGQQLDSQLHKMNWQSKSHSDLGVGCAMNQRRGTDMQAADFLTKPLQLELHEACCKLVGLLSSTEDKTKAQCEDLMS